MVEVWRCSRCGEPCGFGSESISNAVCFKCCNPLSKEPKFMDKTCKTCKYYHQYPEDHAFGDCRRHAPSADLNPPRPLRSYWCGEWAGEMKFEKAKPRPVYGEDLDD